ncbi:hypothetical protein GGQ85_001998 [Nitrobacter vulgaris]|nr:hypothetical protein [Nitrobacter vulgaris]
MLANDPVSGTNGRLDSKLLPSLTVVEPDDSSTG